MKLKAKKKYQDLIYKNALYIIHYFTKEDEDFDCEENYGRPYYKVITLDKINGEWEETHFDYLTSIKDCKKYIIKW